MSALMKTVKQNMSALIIWMTEGLPGAHLDTTTTYDAWFTCLESGLQPVPMGLALMFNVRDRRDPGDGLKPNAIR